jgi:hypothetical protein
MSVQFRVFLSLVSAKLCGSLLENTKLCLQEHFLWNFQKNEMKKLVPNMGNYTIGHDTNDLLKGFKLPRGQAGVVILWPQEWNGRIKKLKLGNVDTVLCFPY